MERMLKRKRKALAWSKVEVGVEVGRGGARDEVGEVGRVRCAVECCEQMCARRGYTIGTPLSVLIRSEMAASVETDE